MTRAELNGVRFLQKELKMLEEELTEKRKASATIAPAIDGLPKGSSIRSKVEALTMEILVLEERIANYKAAIPLAQAGLLDRLLSLSVKPSERAVVILLYVEGQTVSEVTKRIGVTTRSVKRLQASFIKKMSP